MRGFEKEAKPLCLAIHMLSFLEREGLEVMFLTEKGLYLHQLVCQERESCDLMLRGKHKKGCKGIKYLLR